MSVRTLADRSPADASPSLLASADAPDFWRAKAAKAFRSGVHEAAWRRYVADRPAAPSLSALSGAAAPLGWGVAPAALSELTRELLLAAGNARGRAGRRGKPSKAPRTAAASDADLAATLGQWLETAREASPTCDAALAALAACSLLADRSDAIAMDLWWQAADSLLRCAEEASAWRADLDAAAEQAFAQQALAGELPLALSYLFPEIGPLHALRSAARERLTEGLLELTNGEGLLHGRHSGWFPLFAAAWTRCRLIGAELKKNAWSGEAETQFRWLVRQWLRWLASDGTTLLADSPFSAATPPEMAACLLRLAGDRSDAAAAGLLLGKRAVPQREAADDYAPPDPSDHCEWAGLSVFRAGWRPAAPTAAVRCRGAVMELELTAGPTRLVVGSWDAETRVNGKRLAPLGEWEEVCWFSDADADYLEWSLALEGGAAVDRQILLLRGDEVLWLADNVRWSPGTATDEAPRLWHRVALPLGGGIALRPAAETREALLTHGPTTVAAALPLALPEWRADPRGGRLEAVENRLELVHEARGRALACPLLLDLRPRRSATQVTWRQLTVAQALEIQPPDVAVGYRAQCGDQQWLFYRSLAPRANRTVLGQNTASEFLAARFLAPQGTVEELVQVEG